MKQQNRGISQSKSDQINHPKTIKEAVGRIISIFPPKELKKLALMSEDELIRCHFGLGMWVRNNFGLWQGNKALMADAKTKVPDDASMKIIKAVWRELKNKQPAKAVKRL